MKFNISYIVLVILLTSCQNSFQNKLKGQWDIEEYYGNFEIIQNTIYLENNNKCQLPISRIEDRYSDQKYGKWYVFSENDSLYLKINSSNKRFNNVYHIAEFKRVQDPVSFGYLQIMTLVGQKDSVVFFCKKALDE